MPSQNMAINGKAVHFDGDDRTLLVDFLRDALELTGTHVGCDTSQCGACVVLMDGVAVKSCTILARQAEGREITTIEGLSGKELHPLQAAFQQCHALQCGFCTPGMILAAHDMIRRGAARDEAQIRHELEGNLCRCTGYQNIVKAIKAAAINQTE